MFLTDEQKKTAEHLDMIRKKVELLDSHKLTMGQYITDKQYYESLKAISDELETIEHQYNIERPKHTLNEKLKACFDILNDISNDLEKMQIKHDNDDDYFDLDDMFENVLDSIGFTEEEKYNFRVQKAINEVVE